jgi:hypothetical protein
MSVHDDQRGGPSERGEGLTLQVQEKLPSLSLSTEKNSSSLRDNIDSSLGLRDSIDFSRATRTFGLIAVKSWNSSDPFSQISSTISKDDTGGECARQAKLLADFGQKIKFGPVQHNFTSIQAPAKATMGINLKDPYPVCFPVHNVRYFYP